MMEWRSGWGERFFVGAGSHFRAAIVFARRYYLSQRASNSSDYRLRIAIFRPYVYIQVERQIASKRSLLQVGVPTITGYCRKGNLAITSYCRNENPSIIF